MNNNFKATKPPSTRKRNMNEVMEDALNAVDDFEVMGSGKPS